MKSFLAKKLPLKLIYETNFVRLCASVLRGSTVSLTLSLAVTPQVIASVNTPEWAVQALVSECSSHAWDQHTYGCIHVVIGVAKVLHYII